MTTTTPSRPTGRALTAVALLVAAALLSGCGLLHGDDTKPASSTSAPAPSGTGSYPEPATPTAAESIAPGRSGAPKGGIPSPGDVDQKNATAVSRGALTAMFTYDTTLDTSPHDASVRTAQAGWCTPKFADQLRQATPRAAPGAEWTTWHHHRAYTRVKLTRADEAGRPADTATTAYRQWTVTITPHGRDSWTGTPTDTTAFVELTRPVAAKPWRVSAVSIQ
jgi:hypothetical protein